MSGEEKAGKRRGRPPGTAKNAPKWRASYVGQARRLAAIGLTDAEMAAFFGVSVRSIHHWKQRHAAFAEALTIGKEAADARVEQALYHRAVGYAHDAVKIHTIAGKVVETAYVERYPPDVTAAMFWLKNRRPDLWRERSEMNLVADLAQRIAAGRARLIEGERGEPATPALEAPLSNSHPSLFEPPAQGGEEE
ncbi:hypothetical protein [Flavisphingomonas formosensis]|uniref:hypothetical protein n=1 Tax=Flavisphingomonas formosensis TaxID=861534 RepID=UPI0012FA6746|nr:hypothetical protein [Sphingomonas formosensis]